MEGGVGCPCMKTKNKTVEYEVQQFCEAYGWSPELTMQCRNKKNAMALFTRFSLFRPGSKFRIVKVTKEVVK